jgi:hypothetical protein
VDLSGLIFVALAVAWAAYLIPKALRHHEDVVRGRSVDRFSHSMRVLARREPVSARAARLVVTPSRDGQVAAARSPEEQHVARRAATSRATKRRRRVLGLLVLAIAGTVAACVDHRLGWPVVAIPAGLLLAWLVACRLMVRKERSWRPVDASLDAELTGEIAPVVEPVAGVAESPPEVRDPRMWDPVPVTLPTYVSKPPARRSVRTIDLDATGVWTSGRSEADSALARDAEAAERVRRRASRKDESSDEAVGS